MSIEEAQSIEETGRRLREILAKVEELQPLFAERTRDQLLEMWMKRDEGGRYNDPVSQFALKTALKRHYNVEVPLYPYDPMTPQQRFWLQPLSIIAATEQRVRTRVEQNATHAFEVMQRSGFPLDVATQVAMIETRIREEMSTNAHKYWKE